MSLAKSGGVGTIRVAMSADAPTSGRLAPEEASARGAEEAFLECYREYRDHVFRSAMRYAGGRRDVADDLTQEVFIKLMDRWEELSARGELHGWLYRVTANLAISKLRREQRWTDRVRTLLASKPAGPVGPDQELATRQAMDQVVAALDALPPKQRVVLVMRVLDGKSQREIAEVIGVSEGYASKLLKRAQAKLRKAGWEVLDG